MLVAVGILAVLVGLIAVSPPGRAFIAEKRALKDGADAYLFGYPLVTMLETADSFRPSPDAQPWVNRFVHLRYLPDAQTRQVVRPNRDTVYSIAWLDLSDGPVLVEWPDMGGTYWLLPLMDAWTHVIAPLGARTSGNGPGRVLVAGPGWEGNAPAGTEVARSTTPLVWALARLQIAPGDDPAAVSDLQGGLTVTPYRDDGTPAGPPTESVWLERPAADAGETVRAVVDGMDAETFFTALARGLQTQPLRDEDQGILPALERIGIRPGEPLDWGSLSDDVRVGLQEAVGRVQQGMTDAFRDGQGSVEINGWRVPPMTLGAYGGDHAVRAVVAREGLGANLPEDALYATAVADADGEPLRGDRTYAVTVDSPPAGAFWSVTVYGDDGFLVPGGEGHYSVSGTPGSGPAEISVGPNPPSDPGMVWLRTPDGPFSLMMRLYDPGRSALDNAWSYPPVVRTG